MLISFDLVNRLALPSFFLFQLVKPLLFKTQIASTQCSSRCYDDANRDHCSLHAPDCHIFVSGNSSMKIRFGLFLAISLLTPRLLWFCRPSSHCSRGISRAFASTQSPNHGSPQGPSSPLELISGGLQPPRRPDSGSVCPIATSSP